MALDLDTIKAIQGLLSDMTTTANFLAKLRESKEISFTVAGVTSKVNSKSDPEAYQMIFESLSNSSSQKLDKTRDNINQLLYSDKEAKLIEEKA